MKVNITVTGFEFKRAEFSESFKKAIKLQMRNGAREFLKAALPRVPVRTGFARGTLLNLADAIGIAASSNPIAFKKKLAKRPLQDSPVNSIKEYYLGVLKTPEAARGFSTPIGRVFTNNGKAYSFNYDNTVLYYEINDEVYQWKSFELGSAAFIDYLEHVGLQRIPAISEYIIRKKLS